jgi:hypothetical protein
MLEYSLQAASGRLKPELQHLGGIHEDASVKIGSETIAGFPMHPFGITRQSGAPLVKIRSLPFTTAASKCHATLGM